MFHGVRAGWWAYRIKQEGRQNMPNLMSDAVNLMLVGMGFVFVFLIILVFVTSVMSRLLIYFAPDLRQVSAADHVSVDTGNTIRHAVDSKSASDVQLMAVISAAVAKYRSQHKK